MAVRGGDTQARTRAAEALHSQEIRRYRDGQDHSLQETTHAISTAAQEVVTAKEATAMVNDYLRYMLGQILAVCFVRVLDYVFLLVRLRSSSNH
jgi:hypothetical protein